MSTRVLVYEDFQRYRVFIASYNLLAFYQSL